MSIRLRGGRVFLDGIFRNVDIVIDDQGVVRDDADASRDIDIRGHYVLPGLADIHVHLREPGFSYKETIATGTRAAARGGFTTVGAMPNVAPPPDNLAELEKQIEAYRRDAVVEVLPYSCLTTGGNGRGAPVDYPSLAPHVIGFSDDGFGVQSEETMRQVMRGVADAGSIVAQHIEDLELAGDGYINDGEYAATHGHKGKSAESEWRQLERDLHLVEETGCNYHGCHVSTVRSVELIREAKAKGLPVTAETAPHYLALSDDMLQEDGRFRMNPPIRSREDREALCEALLDGTIDMIATDHAPHSAEEKAGGLEKSANGVVGLENSLSVIYTEFVHSGRMTMEDLVRVMCVAPRTRFKTGGGRITMGSPADLIVFDPNFHEPLDTSKFQSKGRATPFDGIDLHGQVALTLCKGHAAWDPHSWLA
ncbi:dihydroorotase [Actinomycetaceae bacterium WB03_NA08]|uniref:Dihydroorotase n=1 Tax=Scrofimicrobium canadense TaxID=2652290 RepID=A0A6N7VRM9_9ACTO|nr:dihydroorotase [Scrofimicrobium canadense]MSS84429.1 dihydroorotase [Scrofimicrobium canadense]